MSVVNAAGRPIRAKPSMLRAQLQLILGILIIISLFSSNPVLTCAALLAVGLIWFGAMSNPVNVIVAAYLSFQWLQVSMLIFIADLTGTELGVTQESTVRFGGHLVDLTDETPSAILLGLACILIMTYAFRAFAPRLCNFRPNLSNYLPWNLLIVYFCLWAINLMGSRFIAVGLAQPLFALGWLRFVPAVLLFTQWLTRREATFPLLIVVAFEIITGFLGFFSGFRNIFFIFGTLILMLHQVLERRAIKILSIACAVLLVLGSFWTAIKPTYRAALNRGTSSQVVLLGTEDRLTLLTDLANTETPSKMMDGLIGMAVRIAYVDYLGKVMHNVPELIPYENGNMWGAAFQNLTPRILFPEKAVLASDSVQTMRYTGSHLGSDQEGTSISMGYVADSYIDFGLIGALIASLLLGVFYALIARSIVRLNRDVELTIPMAVLIAVFFPIQQFETSSVKLLGGMLWAAIAGAFFIRYLWPNLRLYCTR